MTPPHKTLSGKWATDPALAERQLAGCARRTRSALLPRARASLEARTASAERQLATVQELLTASTARATEAEASLLATQRDPDGSRVRASNARYVETIAGLRARIRVALDHLRRHEHEWALRVLAEAVEEPAT